jgi:hypothetical protein
MQPYANERMCLMKKLTSIAVALTLTGCLATVGADGRVSGGEADFRLSLPVLLPPLVVVQPGFAVVQDLDEEVFFVDGYYWARQDRYWYRSRDHRHGWARVEQRHVPSMVAQAPPGRYRRYHGDERDRDDKGRGHEKHDKGHGHDGRDDDRR